MIFRKTRTPDVPADALGIILVILVVCPVIMLIAETFFPDGHPAVSSTFRILARKDNIVTIANSLGLGIGVVLLSSLISFPLAWILAKTDIGNHRWLEIVFLIPFMTPPYIDSMGWILFMQKRGLLEQLLPACTGFEHLFFTFGGIVLVMSLHVFPFMLNFLKNAMISVNSNLEEAAAVFGARPVYRLRRILIPVLSGDFAIGALLVFVKTLSEYGTPATLGRKIGLTFFTTKIHYSASMAPVDFHQAAALSLILVIICLCAWKMQQYWTKRKRVNLITGKGIKTNRKKLSSVERSFAWGYIILLTAVSIGIPYFSICATALMKIRGYGLAAGNFTFAHFTGLFTGDTGARQALVTSFVLGIAAASIAAVLGTAIAVAIRYSRSKQAAAIVETLGLFPEMVPNIVMVIGMMLFWNTIYRLLPLYNTLGMAVVVYLALFLPFTIQYVSAALGQISDNLREAGQISGARKAFIFVHITLPLIFKGTMTGWIMTFIISFRELVASSLVMPPGGRTVSTYIMDQFDQGSVSTGMCMSLVCLLLTTTTLVSLQIMQRSRKRRGGCLPSLTPRS